VDLAYIAIAVVAVLVVLTLVWGARRPAVETKPAKRYSGFRGASDESDAL
jgi:hypothetical protein